MTFDLRQIKYFVQVARLKSFTKAATVLNVAQPALSRQIKLLEEELGTKLLFRTTREVSLTADGERLLEMGGGLLEQMQRIYDTMQNGSTHPHGDINVGVPPSLASSVGRFVFEKCREEFPDIRLRVIEGLSIFLEEWLTLGRIDMAILSGGRKRPDLAIRELGSEPLFLATYSERSIFEQPSLTLSDIAALDNLITTSGFRTTIDDEIAATNIVLKYLYEVDSISMLKNILHAEDCVTLLPASVIYHEGFDKDCRVLRITDPPIFRHIVLATNPARQVGEAARHVQQILEAKTQSVLETFRNRPA